MKKALIFGLILAFVLVTASVIFADDSTGTAQYLVNNSTIYKVAPGSLYTTSLNELTVITLHRVIASTLIYLDGQPVQLLDLKPGLKVSVLYINDAYKTAVSIKASTL